VVALVRVGEVRPRPSDLFFTHSLLWVELVFILGQVPATLVHVGYHPLAGRRAGLPSRLSIGNRLYFIVFETTLQGLLGLPRRQRYLPFLAGMVSDVLWFSSFTLLAVAAAAGDGPMPWWGRLALALAYPTVLRFLWQLLVVLRTDLYYFLATYLGCVDLHGATNARLRNAVWRALGQPRRLVDESQWSDRDRAVARWYAPVAAAMTTVLMAVGVVALVPALVRFLEQVVAGLDFSTVSTLNFWISAVAGAIWFVPTTAGAWMGIRNSLRGRRPLSARISEPATEEPS
jgi:hypothetical protein